MNIEYLHIIRIRRKIKSDNIVNGWPASDSKCINSVRLDACSESDCTEGTVRRLARRSRQQEPFEFTSSGMRSYSWRISQWALSAAESPRQEEKPSSYHQQQHHHLFHKQQLNISMKFSIIILSSSFHPRGTRSSNTFPS